MGRNNTIHHTGLTYRQFSIQNAIIYACCAIGTGFGVLMALSAAGVI